MNTKQHKKLVQAGGYIAEVDIELIESDGGWSPYLSLDDAQKLDEIREALKNGNVKEASKRARIYTLTPVAV